jgi:hypothetical protein
MKGESTQNERPETYVEIWGFHLGGGDDDDGDDDVNLQLGFSAL